jgi:dipeptidase D
MDMISLGPTIKNPHSPEERLHLPSVEKVWIFLVALLKGYR